MTHTQQFIEDAIAGGWNRDTVRHGADENGDWIYIDDLALLDPAVWQAVGKTRRWGKRYAYFGPHPTRTYGARYRFEWHRFIDALADGKTIEEALAAISL